jgi:hypothetical protein
MSKSRLLIFLGSLTLAACGEKQVTNPRPAPKMYLHELQLQSYGLTNLNVEQLLKAAYSQNYLI